MGVCLSDLLQIVFLAFVLKTLSVPDGAENSGNVSQFRAGFNVISTTFKKGGYAGDLDPQ